MVPFEVREAAIDALGSNFWFKNQLRQFLTSAGVPQAKVASHVTDDVPKFVGVRSLFESLDADGRDGEELQLRILTELNKLRKPPGTDLKDPDAAADKLRYFKKLARDGGLVPKSDTSTRPLPPKRDDAEAARNRSGCLRALKLRFVNLHGTDDRKQARGYELEKILEDLFEANGIDYRGPYKVSGEQIDGEFEYKGFHYLVEARWRKKPPTVGQLGEFKIKIDGKLQSTRGIFCSVVGFNDEMVSALRSGRESNLILMDGEDLILILEEQISLPDALDVKIAKASQEGEIFFRLRQHFS